MQTDEIKKSLSRKSSPNPSILDYGKLPPQDKQVEEAVLGALLLEEKAIYTAIELIKSESVFYVIAHQLIWKAMAMLYHHNSKVDMLTVRDQMIKNGDLDAAGGWFYLAELTNKVGSAANIETHIRIIIEHHIKRQLIAISTEVNQEGYDDTIDAFDALNNAGNRIDTLNMEMSGQSNESFADKVLHAASLLKKAAESGNHLTGVPTFSEILDHQLMGLQPSDLIIVASRPAMGKTSIVWHIAKNQAKNDIPIGFFSLEMNDTQLINKMFASETHIDVNQVKRGNLSEYEWEVFDRATQSMMLLPIFLNDTGGIGINQLIAVAKNWVRKHEIKVLYIDYLQLITTHDTGRKFGSREQEVSYIASKLKATAKELDIPIVALAQLSRGPESRNDKRPLLSDLRESGAIEQDADIVIFPFRPEYYGQEFDEHGNKYPEGLTELDIAKFRNGATTAVRWVFDKRHSSFKDFDGFEAKLPIPNPPPEAYKKIKGDTPF